MMPSGFLRLPPDGPHLVQSHNGYFEKIIRGILATRWNVTRANHVILSGLVPHPTQRYRIALRTFPWLGAKGAGVITRIAARWQRVLLFRLFQGDAVETPVLQNVFFFKIGAHQQAIGGGQWGHKINDAQSFEFGAYRANVFKITGVIGDDAQDTSRHKNAQCVEKERRLNKPAFVVAGFGPRIRKVDMQRVDRLVRNVGANPPVGIGANHAGIGKLMPADPVGGKITIGSRPLDSDKIMIGKFSSSGQKERAFSGADLHLHGMIIKKNIPPGKHTRIIGDNQQGRLGN